MSKGAYARAGVDIAAGHRATELMRAAVHATYGPEVLSDVGNFGGLFEISRLKEMSQPVLVASTDGVGTKTMVAGQLGRWDTIGQDIVNHCLNDILVQGATPLFFLDYIASSQLDPEQIATVVGGAALACRQAGGALLGGETAEMPGVYQAGAVDLVGTIVGVVDRSHLIDGSHIRDGDIILGLPASGLHTNGYTLARSALEALDWDQQRPELAMSIGDVLLAPHRSYLTHLRRLWQAGIKVRGLAHITGGGLIDNLPRIFPKGLGAAIWRGRWPEPPIFDLIQKQGRVSDAEMFHVFNMGLGILIVIPPNAVASAERVLDDVYIVGEITDKVTGVTIRE
jgi:phosphoribosylformylglycinamidine cyclo-ligase